MKKCAVINDLSGFGKCSLTASIPIMSAMGVEVHPLLTAVLSNQTAYDSFKSVSLTHTMRPFIDEWKKLGAKFDGILTGFVTDKEQLNIISEFIDDFKTNDTLVVVDPVMADNGALYDGYDIQMCNVIRDFCFRADVITPNTTELAILADKKCENVFNEAWVNDYQNIEISLNALYKQGLKKIVVTGFKEDDLISNIVFDNGIISKVSCQKIRRLFQRNRWCFCICFNRLIIKRKFACGFLQKSGRFYIKYN